MESVFTYERIVEFADTDAAGIAHFTKIIQYMESAEHALLRSLNWSVMPAANRSAKESLCEPQHSQDIDPESFISWPRVKVNVDYAGPAYFEDRLHIDVKILRIGRSSVTFNFAVHRRSLDSDAVNLIATGDITSVCCILTEQKKMKSIEIPDILRTQLSKYVISSSHN